MYFEDFMCRKYINVIRRFHVHEINKCTLKLSCTANKLIEFICIILNYCQKLSILLTHGDAYVLHDSVIH